MGNFLFMSGVIGKPAPEVVDVLEQFVVAKGGFFQESGFQESNEMNCTIFENSIGTIILYPSTFFAFAECSTHLSKELNCPAFSFHVHDSDLWMYELSDKGQGIDKFNPIPHFWDGSVSDVEKAKQQGNPRLVANLIDGINEADIKQYYKEWDETTILHKAYPEDEYSYEAMQVFDFISKIGLENPINEPKNQKKIVYDLELMPQFDF